MKAILRVMTYVGALALVLALVPVAKAQCGLPIKMAKPASWAPQLSAQRPRFVAVEDNNDQRGPSIVGMWHVVFTGQTLNNAPFSGIVDNAIVVWHNDGTEIMNSNRPAQDGNFCLGVWARTGALKYHLNHIPWQGNDPSGGPAGIGQPEDGVQLTEDVTLSADGNSYTGRFTLVAYDSAGNVSVTFTGTISATRITPDTPFTSLL